MLHQESDLSANQKSRSNFKSSPAAEGSERSREGKRQWSEGETAPGQSKGLASSWLYSPGTRRLPFESLVSTVKGRAGLGDKN